jgi:hypothetical protein
MISSRGTICSELNSILKYASELRAVSAEKLNFIDVAVFTVELRGSTSATVMVPTSKVLSGILRSSFNTL